MTDSVFSKIIRGELPSQKIYEDDFVIAILDIGPLSQGHTLVIPKEPAETIDALSDAAAEALGRVLPRITRAVKKVTGCGSYNILQNNGSSAGQAVMHVHFHIIPRFPDRAEGGLTFAWSPSEGDAEGLADLGRQLARLL